MTELVILPAGRSEWFNCSPDQITWLDRAMLSGGQDPTLHRSPRCPGLRHVQYRWELFSRDTTHAVYLAPYDDGSPGHFQDVQARAVNTLPPALPRFETYPVELAAGGWVVSVGKWTLPLRITGSEDDAEPSGDQNGVAEEEKNTVGPTRASGAASPALPDAVSRVDAYFQRNGVARMALAFYYRDYILGTVAPQTTAMIDVAIALDLSSEGSVGEFEEGTPAPHLEPAAPPAPACPVPARQRLHRPPGSGARATSRRRERGLGQNQGGAGTSQLPPQEVMCSRLVH